jgi:hypothetical protein
MKPARRFRISLSTSLGIAGLALILRLVPIPFDGNVLKGLGFWVLLAAYSVLVVAFIKK